MKARGLWASTGTKDPAYPDTLYVTGLIADAVVNTMPEQTLRAFADHGEIQASIEGRAAEAHAVLAELAAAGIDLDDVFARLEADGIDKFITSWDQLVASVQAAQALLA